MFMPVNSTRHQSIATQRWALAGLSFSMLLSSLGTSVANVALPTLVTVFDASFQSAQWVVLSYLLAITTLIVSVGRLGDIIGRRRLLLVGILLFTLASMVCGAAPALWVLMIARGVQGLGAAIMMSLSMAVVGEIASKEKTGSAMGLLGTMSAIGTALGPSLGGALIAGAGWRAIFLVMVPLGLLTLLLSHRYLPDDRNSPERTRSRFDAKGTVLMALTLGAYALAMTVGKGSFGSLNVILLIIALFVAALFIRVQTRSTSPLIQPAIFRDLSLSASFVMNGIVMTVMMATLVVGPFYLSHGLGLDAARVGLVLSVGPFIAAFSGVPAGRLVDRFGAHRVSFGGLIAIASGLLLMSMITLSEGVYGYIARIIIITAGHALFQTANNTSVMRDIPSEQRGIISGLLNLSRNLGLITGASVMGAVFAFASSAIDITTALPADIATGMRTTFAVATVLVFVALAVGIGRAFSVRRPGVAVALIMLASPLIAREGAGVDESTNVILTTLRPMPLQIDRQNIHCFVEHS
jgi:EmrB/QacA subfamily drug resistance transporter